GLVDGTADARGDEAARKLGAWVGLGCEDKGKRTGVVQDGFPHSGEARRIREGDGLACVGGDRRREVAVPNDPIGEEHLARDGWALGEEASHMRAHSRWHVVDHRKRSTRETIPRDVYVLRIETNAGDAFQLHEVPYIPR